MHYDRVTQAALDGVRHACLCNLSLCYSLLGRYRSAVEAAGRVLSDVQALQPDMRAKALFRRAKAYRHLDEYEYFWFP